MAWLDGGSGEQLEEFKLAQGARNIIHNMLKVKHDRKSIEDFLHSVEQRLPIFLSIYRQLRVLPTNKDSKEQINDIIKAAKKLIRRLDAASETTRTMLITRRNTGTGLYREVKEIITIAESALLRIKPGRRGPNIDAIAMLTDAVKYPWLVHFKTLPKVTRDGPFMKTLDAIANQTEEFKKARFDDKTIRELLKKN
jgi:hypothetical protein